MQRKDNFETRLSNTKISTGIACCRLDDNDKLQVLLVSHKNTYAFLNFVYGKYGIKKIGKKNNDINNNLLMLFNEMTVDEKMEILSLDFKRMWNRAWYSNNLDSLSLYQQYKNKFDTTFIVPDNGKNLRKIIENSQNGQKIWSIPKGKIKYIFEKYLNCAVREFHEETGIDHTKYKILPEITKTITYNIDGITYKNIFYIAFTKFKIEPKIIMKNNDQINEIGDIRWMNIEDVKIIDHRKILTPVIQSIFKYIYDKIDEI